MLAPRKLESLSLENWIQTGKRTINCQNNSQFHPIQKIQSKVCLRKMYSMFREEKIFKNEFDSIFVMAPCCFHPVHKLCVNQFTRSRGRDKLCKNCGTDHSELREVEHLLKILMLKYSVKD